MSKHAAGIATALVTLLACLTSAFAETAILGETGSSGNYFNTANRIRAIVRTAPQDGTLDSIYVLVANVPSGAVAKGVLYDSTTLTIVDSTAEKELSVDGGSFHWEGFAFGNGGQIESGKTYLLGILVGPTYVGISREASSDSRYYVDYTYSDGVPHTLSGGTWATDQVHSIYVVYSITSGDVPAPHRRRIATE